MNNLIWEKQYYNNIILSVFNLLHEDLAGENKYFLVDAWKINIFLYKEQLAMETYYTKIERENKFLVFLLLVVTLYVWRS